IHARPAELVQLDEAGVLGVLAAHARAGDDRRRLARRLVPLESGVADCLARGDHSELREAVDVVRLLLFEIVGGIVTLNFGAVLESQFGPGDQFDRAYSAAALFERVPEVRRVPAQRGNNADAGDGHATHGAIGPAPWRPWIPTRVSRYL